jgi:hypothetical protein
MWELLGYRSDKRAMASVLAAGCAVRRRDDNLIHFDWNLDRVVAAIRSAAQDPEKPAIADALAVAFAKHQTTERVAARKRRHVETEAASREEEAAVVSGLEVELRTLLATGPGMSLLDVVEYTTTNPDLRIVSMGVAVSRNQTPTGWVKTTSVF